MNQKEEIEKLKERIYNLEVEVRGGFLCEECERWINSIPNTFNNKHVCVFCKMKLRRVKGVSSA